MRIMQMPASTAQAMELGHVIGFCRALAAGCNPGDALRFARQLGMSAGVVSICERSAVSITEPPLTSPQQMQFVSSLAHFGVLDRIMTDSATVTAPMKTPLGKIGSIFTATPHEPGQWIPLSSLEVEDGMLTERSVATITVVTKELLSAVGPAGETMFSQELRSACAAATDAVFLGEILATAPSGTAAGLPGAIANVMGALETGPNARVYLIFSPTVARQAAGAVGESGLLYPLCGVSGGAIGVTPVLTSDQLADDEIAAVDAAQVVTNPGEVQFSAARSASVQMSDSPAAAASPLTSLFQVNSIGLRCLRTFAFEVVGDGAAAKCQITTP